MFRVIGTETYLDELIKWPKSDREAAEKLPAKLAEDPHVGQLLYFPFYVKNESVVEGYIIWCMMT